MSSKADDLLRWIEWILLFILTPVILFFIPLTVPMLPCLLAISIGCAVVLLRDPTFIRSRLWTLGPFKSFARILLLRTLLTTIFLVGLLSIFDPTLLLNFLREKPKIWLLVMVFYPLFSAYPQELIYRASFSTAIRFSSGPKRASSGPARSLSPLCTSSFEIRWRPC